MLTEFGDNFGVDLTKLSDAVCQALVGNEYTADNLSYSVELLYQSTKKDNTPITSGGRGKASNSVQSVMVPVTPLSIEPYVEENPEFSDMSGFEWASDAVKALTDKSVISGKFPKRFCPADSILREEFVKMTMQSLKFSDLYGDFAFDDVSRDAWYYYDVKNAYLSGIIKGISNNMFGSGSCITRQDMAVMLYNALEKKGYRIEGGSGKDFKDKADIADYAAEAVNALSETGIINGDDNNCFNPIDNASRAEVVMIYGALSYIEVDLHEIYSCGKKDYFAYALFPDIYQYVYSCFSKRSNGRNQR